MRHAFIDVYADLNTPLQKFNIKARIIFFFIFLLVVILTPIRYKAVFLIYSVITLTLVYLSRVPLNFILKRVLHILPFIIIISLSPLFKKQGITLFLNCMVKASLAVLLFLVLSTTTRFDYMLEALKQLHTPGLFIHLLSFMYRYSFLLEDQLLKSRRAYASRNIHNKSIFQTTRVLSNIVGTLFIRTYERAERVYLAMCARGYDGTDNS